MSTACLPTDHRVLAKMKELVVTGVRRVPEMQRHVKHYVENELFANGNVPALTDARFWPSSRVIVNCIYKTARNLRYVCICMILKFLLVFTKWQKYYIAFHIGISVYFGVMNSFIALQQAEMRMVTWMCGVKVKDRLPGKELRERLGVDDIALILQQNRLRWYGHVLRKDDDDWVKKCMEYEVEG